MTTNARTQAILLLTARLGSKPSAQPLSIAQYNRLVRWLTKHDLTPEALIERPVDGLLADWQDPKVPVERIEALLDRGTALAMAQEKWQRSGIWVITRSDKGLFPKRFRERLGEQYPPLLFGVGQASLLNAGGLAVVGSRKAGETDLDYATKLGQMAAAKGVPIISGGARGVDETAMLGALDSGGTAVGILANHLLRAALSKKYRSSIQDERLVLVSPYHPEARFHVGTAMQRNKYIYALADAAVAVHSGDSGGTWTGALENIKQQWVPLFVKKNRDPKSGNKQLMQAGGIPLPEAIDAVDPDELFRPSVASRPTDLFNQPPQEEE